jgi:hypothetical protein
MYHRPDQGALAFVSERSTTSDLGAASPAYIFETSQRAILCPREKQTDPIRLESPRIWTRMMTDGLTDPAYVPLPADVSPGLDDPPRYV